MGEVQELAPAKINFALHVTGRRADGYHLLDSLVVFSEGGVGADRISVALADSFSLFMRGEGLPAGLAGEDNLALRAGRLYGQMVGRGGARVTLEKRLPVAAGIGGGSSDAAATIRALATLWRTPLPPPGALLELGADVPVCLQPRPWRMSGVGGKLAPAIAPSFDVVLVNPRVPVPTGAVFARLENRDNPPLPPLPERDDKAEWLAWLLQSRNDLEPPAEAAFPIIGEVKAALSQAGAPLLVRMSGSGGTCFAIHPDAEAARVAAAAISSSHPDWWVVAARTGSG